MVLEDLLMTGYSYLNNRKQCVEINKISNNNVMTSFKSNFVHNKFGVPQGSVLGPLLFLLYINDLPNITPHKCVLFADDISIIIPKDKIKDFEVEINKTIINVIDWLNSNNLKVNIGKTNFMQFYNIRSKPLNLNIKHQNNIIKETSSATFLGIIIDQHCDWKAHVAKVCSRISSFVYALRRLSLVASRDTSLTAYHGYVSAVLRYGLLMWGNSVEFNQAFKAQKRCIRAICCADPLDSCQPLFKELKVLTLPSMYIFEICTFVKKHPEHFKKIKDNCSYYSRYPNRLLLPQCNNVLFQRNCFVMAIKIYNHIPETFKELSYFRFRNQVFKWLLEKNFYSLKEFLELKH